MKVTAFEFKGDEGGWMHWKIGMNNSFQIPLRDMKIPLRSVPRYDTSEGYFFRLIYFWTTEALLWSSLL